MPFVSIRRRGEHSSKAARHGATWITKPRRSASPRRAAWSRRRGVGGLTLSGGLGWLRGSHGLSIDNLEGVDIVTADGRLLHADESRHPDLFWAVRGGGGNFGIVTSFEFRLHPIAPELMFCAPFYPVADAARIIAAWRDFVATSSERFASVVEFSTIPESPDFPPETHGERVLGVYALYDGPVEEGETALAPLRQFGTPLVDLSGAMPYAVVQSAFDGLFPKGRDRSYFKSHYLAGLGDGVIADIVDHWRSRPSAMSLTLIWHLGGAVQRVAPEATAFGDRSMSFMLSIDSIWSRPEDDAANIGWSRDFWSAMRRHSNGRLYLNFAGHGEGEDLVRNAHGAEVFARLAAVKRTYDPENFFRLNQNVAPA